MNSTIADAVVNWAIDFRWEAGVTPASSFSVPASGALVYLVAVYTFKNFRPGEEIRSKSFEIVHNVFLIFLSLGMLVGVLWAAWLRHKEEGVVGGLLCTQRSSERLWDGPLGAVTYVFYLSKYYEFIDTFVLALRKKPTIPLHLWHHAVMPVMVWSWFAFPWVDGAWWCVMVNSFIHTLMYTNYLLTSLGSKVWWAKYLTQAQIVQFLTGTAVSVTFFYMKNTGKGCSGDERTAIASNLVNFTFILLFIKFYFDKYQDTAAKKKDEKKSK